MLEKWRGCLSILKVWVGSVKKKELKLESGELDERISIVALAQSPGTYSGLPRYSGVSPRTIDNVKRLE